MEISTTYMQLHLEKVENTNINLLICCGDFQVVRNEKDLESLNVKPKFRAMNSFWKYYSGQEVAPFPTIFIGGNHEAIQLLLIRVVSLNFCSRKELFISGSLDRTVILWDQRAEKCQTSLLHVQGRHVVAYDDQGVVFSIAYGGFIRMFDARMYDKGPFVIFSVGGDVSDASVVKFSNDGTHMLLTATGGHIHVSDASVGRERTDMIFSYTGVQTALSLSGRSRTEVTGDLLLFIVAELH